MNLGWPMLSRASILNGRSAEGHGIADHMVVWDSQTMAKLWQEVVDGPLGQTVPDRAHAEGLGEKFEVGKCNQAILDRCGDVFGG